MVETVLGVYAMRVSLRVEATGAKVGEVQFRQWWMSRIPESVGDDVSMVELLLAAYLSDRPPMVWTVLWSEPRGWD